VTKVVSDSTVRFLRRFNMLPETMKMNFFGEGLQDISLRVFYASLIGLLLVELFLPVTEYYTGLGTNQLWQLYKIVYWCRNKRNCRFATGMISTFPTVICLLRQMVYLCFSRIYGVALAASMMATTAMQLAIDAFWTNI
jgi:K(+)-stimulated pyrophosphate-energized sodium pump